MIYAIEAVTCDGCHDGGHKLGFVKFGKARNPEARVKELATGSPHPLRVLASVDWPDEIESLIHAAFKHRRVNGEWFRPDDHIESFVTTMMCDNSTDMGKYAGCMTILVEMFTGHTLYPSLDRGACRAIPPDPDENTGNGIVSG